MFSRGSGFGSVPSSSTNGQVPRSAATGVLIPAASAPAVPALMDAQRKNAGRGILRFLRRVVNKRFAARSALSTLATESDGSSNAVSTRFLRSTAVLRFAIKVAWLRVLSRSAERCPCADGPATLQAMVLCFRALHPLEPKLQAVVAHMSHQHPTALGGQWVQGPRRTAALVDMVQAATTVVALSHICTSRGGSDVVPPPLLLLALQLLLALRDDPVRVLLCKITGMGADAFLVAAMTERGVSLCRSSVRGSSLVQLSNWGILLGHLRGLEQRIANAMPQDVLVTNALHKIVWSVLDSCVSQLSEQQTPIQFTSGLSWDARRGVVVGEVLSKLFSIKGLRCAALAAAANGDADILKRRIGFCQWIGSRPPIAASAGAGANQAADVAVLNVLLFQLHALSELLRNPAAAVFAAEVDGWMQWWWTACVVGAPAEGNAQHPSMPLVAEKQLGYFKVLGRDPAMCESFASLWSNARLVATLCLPPDGEQNVRQEREQTQGKKPKHHDDGFFAELRRLAASSSHRQHPVPWTQSLLRRDHKDTSTVDGIDKTVVAFLMSFTPPLWVRGATLLALSCVETLQPLHVIAFHGPRVVHQLLAACTTDALLPTILDMLYVAALPGTPPPQPSTGGGGGLLPPATSPIALLHGTVRTVSIVANGCVSLLLQLAYHLLLVTGDKELEVSSCPVPMDRVHALVELCNVLFVDFTKRLLSPSVHRVTSSGASVRSSHDLLRNATTERWLREDAFRLRHAMMSLMRALIDRSLRLPQLTHHNPNLRRKDRASLEQNAYRNDERFWFLDFDRQEALFPGSYATAKDDGKSRRTSSKPTCAWTPLQVALLQSAPHICPFAMRIEYLTKFIAEDRRKFVGNTNAKLGLRIRRDHLLEDLMQQLNLTRANNASMAVDGKYLRAKWHIQFVDRAGLMEAGIDAGGVFKEFMEFVVKESFNPNLGLFVPVQSSDDAATTSVGGGDTASGSSAARVLHPNPHARHVFAGDASYLEFFHFLGMLVAKAIYEGVVLNLEFAPSFLNNVLGRGNSIDDLKAVDGQQFKSLQLLKAMENVADAEVYFCVEEEVLGTVHTVDLIPNGRDVQVTNDNVVRYMHLVAHHMLVKQNKDETLNFAAGFFEVVPKSIVAFLFNQRELQQLISGRNGLRLDVGDLKAHCRLVGGIEAGSRTLTLLWEVLEEMGTDDQGRFLQFCTGCSKPPLLGFGSMNPPFSIRGIDDSTSVLNFIVDVDRLPSASTCFNLLKLPLYRNKSNMKEKLLQAIRSDSGFQLS